MQRQNLNMPAGKMIIVLSLLWLLSSCSTYSGTFSCPEARGANCIMLSSIDRMIDSGEIREVYAKKNKCLWGRCKMQDLPKVRSANSIRIYRVKVENND